MLECQCNCVCCDTQTFLLPDARAAEQGLRCPSCGRPLRIQKLQPFGETEWLECNHLGVLLQGVKSSVSERQLRLFACARCRQVWEQFTDQRSRAAVEVAERFADGQAAREELVRACAAVTERMPGINWDSLVLPSVSALHAEPVAASLFRDIVGNPFRPAPILHPAWRAWNGGAVGKLARAIYEGHQFADLPILADALEEAGCDNATILEHCRAPGLHARGCWALDLVRCVNE